MKSQEILDDFEAREWIINTFGSLNNVNSFSAIISAYLAALRAERNRNSKIKAEKFKEYWEKNNMLFFEGEYCIQTSDAEELFNAGYSCIQAELKDMTESYENCFKAVVEKEERKKNLEMFLREFKNGAPQTYLTSLAKGL